MSTISASTTTTTAYSVTADTTGTLVIQTGATPTTAVTVGTDQSVTFAQAANLPNTFGFKNRIINGAMVIDQRNAGVAVNVSNANATFPVDRFFVYEDTSVATLQVQQANGPDNSTKSFVVTNGTGASATTAQLAQVQHRIEGFNVADLLLGTASASAITLSFWVRSSVTGTYCVSFRNSAQNRSYVAEYTISAANTFERKTVTLTGDTTGTWVLDNGIGLTVTWDLGSGSNFNATAGSWAGTNSTRTTNQTNWINTSSATFFLGGVQLEKGSTATSFDYRPYGTELALCQRYCFVYRNGGTGQTTIGIATCVASTVFRFMVSLPVTMRAMPTYANTSTIYFYDGATNALSTSLNGNASTVDLGWISLNVASGLTLGNSGVAYMDGASGAITFSSEL